jgi:hypothetical protein
MKMDRGDSRPSRSSILGLDALNFLMADVCLPKLAVIVGAQATLGAASAVIPPALAALRLGIVGRKLFPARVSRNESFNHGGNFAAAILAGTIGQRFGYQWIFYLVCLFALASAAAVTLIRPQEIDHDLARGILFTLTDSPLGVVAIQLLDGMAAGIFGVISIIIAADLMRGTGRFNLAQGLVAL